MIYTARSTLSSSRSFAMAPLLDFAYETVYQGCTFASFLLERCLSHLHSTLQTFLTSLGKPNEGEQSTARAWWDTSKGSAVVVWAPGDQNISQALSLSLASIRARSRSIRAGRPPYTVIVILPSTPRSLSSLISAWATRKAKLESDGKDVSRGRRNGSSWYIPGLGNLSFRLGSPDSNKGDLFLENETDSDEVIVEEKHSKGQSEDRSPSGSRPSTPRMGKRRRLSFGGWSAPDLVGYGMDMLKGLRIGQNESPGIGAIIPVVADTSTPDGIAHAHSTIRAYCTSHDLLLRALVVLPSIMSNGLAPTLPKSPIQNPEQKFREAKSPSSSRSREVTKVLEKDELLYQSQASGTSSLSTKSLYGTQNALATDVGETMSVVASLLPALKSDGGRVVAVVPSAFRNSIRKEDGVWEQYIDQIQAEDDDRLEFNVTRKAMLEMWSILQRRLRVEGVQVSQIHMSAPRKQRASTRRLGPHSSHRKNSSNGFTRILLQRVMHSTHSVLYPIPKVVKPAKPYVDSNRNSIVPTSLEDNDSTDACPSLLLDAVRSVLVRSWPRAHYCVGIGPRLETLWECLPGHESIRGWITESLL